MKRTLIALVCLASVATAGVVNGAVINGQYVPDSIAGQKDGSGNYIKYRLILVTEGTTLGSSADVGTYQTFVHDQAAAVGLGAAVYNWVPVVSVYGGSSAKDAVGTSVADIYNLGGSLVAFDSGDLLNGSIAAAVKYYGYQPGQIVADNAHVWTGSRSDGTPAVPMPGEPLYANHTLGSPLPEPTTATARFGIAGSTGADWLSSSDENLSQYYRHVYAISGELSAIPEPSTVVLWSVCSGVAGMLFWRKSRRNS